MKSIINNSLRVAALAALWMASGLVQSCNKEEESLKSVDLRYRVDDAYERLAVNPEPIVFQVKSTDPWEIVGEAQAEGWYTVTPASGEAGKTYDVTIVMNENTSLDDREDVLSIKSDYWTGKTFTIKQIGTAYLEAEDVLMSSDGGTAKIAVSTNQKWSAEVTSGAEWLQITAGASGELDGEITLQMPANAGEQRVGEVTIYDRYDRPAWLATCTEEGVVLSPIEPEHGLSWYMIGDDSEEMVIPIESNADWTVEKSNAKDDWFEIIESRATSGNGQITVKFTENTGEDVRSGKVKLSTVSSVEGVTPLVKEIEFRQAGTSKPQVMSGEFEAAANQVLASGCQPGRYDIYIKSIVRYTGNPGYGVDLAWPDYSPDGSQVLRVWWRTNGIDVGEGLMKVWPGSYVYSSVANRWGGWPSMTVGQPAKISLAFYEFRDDNGDSWLWVEWWLDDQLLVAMEGSKANGGAFEGPFNSLGNGANLVVSAGGFTIEKWEYTPAIDWGEYVPVELQKHPAKQ